MQPDVTSPARPPSQLVSALGGVTMVVGGLASMAAIMQSLFFGFFFNSADVQMFMSGLSGNGVSKYIEMFLNYWPVLAFLYVGWNVSAFASGLGLYLRKEWGRRLFIGVVGVNICLVFAGIYFIEMSIQGMAEQAFGPGYTEVPDSDVASPASLFGPFRIILYFMSGMVLLFFTSIVYFLSKPGIKKEFVKINSTHPSDPRQKGQEWRKS